MSSDTSSQEPQVSFQSPVISRLSQDPCSFLYAASAYESSNQESSEGTKFKLPLYGPRAGAGGTGVTEVSLIVTEVVTAFPPIDMLSRVRVRVSVPSVKASAVMLNVTEASPTASNVNDPVKLAPPISAEEMPVIV